MQSMIMIHIMCIVLRETLRKKEQKRNLHAIFDIQFAAPQNTATNIPRERAREERKKGKKKKQIKFTTYCVNVLLCC